MPNPTTSAMREDPGTAFSPPSGPPPSFPPRSSRVRRSAVDLDELRPRGFKILLELLVRSRGLRTTEVGFAFADRHAGDSKVELLALLARHTGTMGARWRA